MDEKIIEKTPEKYLEKIKRLSEDVFAEIFKGKEKAKQRIVYDLLNYLKTNSRDEFLNYILKILTGKLDLEETRELIALINDMGVKYDTPENFDKMGYTIIMGIMSANTGGG